MFLNSKSFLIFGTLFLVVILYGLGKSIVTNYQVNKEIARLQNEINKLDDQNIEMTQLLEYIQTDDFVAREARMKLGLKKQGEHLVIVQETEGDLEASRVLTENITNDRETINEESNIKKWINFILY